MRKHAGFYGVDEVGEVVDGVAHVDPHFSPYAPPPVAELDEVNARAVLRSQDRDRIRELWRVGETYADRTAHTVRLLPRRRETVGAATGQALVVVRPEGLEVRSAPAPRIERTWRPYLPLGFGLLAAVIVALAATGAPAVLVPVLMAGLGVLGAGVVRVGETRVHRRAMIGYGRALLSRAAAPPSVSQMAGAVADGLHAQGLVSRDSTAVRVDLDPDGEYRCRLDGVPEEESRVFATALEEAVSPIALPRYLVPRRVLLPGGFDDEIALAAAEGRYRPAEHVVWHAVPTVLGTSAARARDYAAAWDRWVGGGAPVYTGSAEGTGVLAAQQGTDPFELISVMRRSWA